METNNTTDINSEAIFEEMSLRREVDTQGNIRYYNKDNHWHRNFGPAIIYFYGAMSYWKNGKWHRLDGPAVIYTDGSVEWYIDGKEYTEEEDYWKEVERIKNGNQ